MKLYDFYFNIKNVSDKDAALIFKILEEELGASGITTPKKPRLFSSDKYSGQSFLIKFNDALKASMLKHDIWPDRTLKDIQPLLSFDSRRPPDRYAQLSKYILTRAVRKELGSNTYNSFFCTIDLPPILTMDVDGWCTVELVFLKSVHNESNAVEHVSTFDFKVVNYSRLVYGNDVNTRVIKEWHQVAQGISKKRCSHKEKKKMADELRSKTIKCLDNEAINYDMFVDIVLNYAIIPLKSSNV